MYTVTIVKTQIDRRADGQTDGRIDREIDRGTVLVPLFHII